MHAHGAPTGKRLWLSALATGIFVIVEATVGWRAGSLALISDAGHNLTDVLALVLSAWAFAVVLRPATPQRTYGYHRVGVLAALLNGAMLVLLAGYIFYESVQRFLRPEPVQSLPMIVVALIALALNTGIALALHHGSQDINVRSVFIHMIGDAAASIGVVVAGIGIWLTGSVLWDPIVSLLIGLFIIWSSWSILRETVSILLEGTPTGINPIDVAHDIEQLPGVANVHDLHIWSLDSDLRALSAHLVITNPSSTSYQEVIAIVQDAKRLLAERYQIAHATLETHCSDHEGTDTILDHNLTGPDQRRACAEPERNVDHEGARKCKSPG